MFENLMVIVVIVVVLWLAGFGAYFYATRQQQNLSGQIDELKKKLDGEGKDAEG